MDEQPDFDTDSRFVSNADRRKITSQANAAKARAARQLKAASKKDIIRDKISEDRLPKYTYQPNHNSDSDDNDNDNDSDTEEEEYTIKRKTNRKTKSSDDEDNHKISNKKNKNKNKDFDKLYERIQFLETMLTQKNDKPKKEKVFKDENKQPELKKDPIIDDNVKKQAVYRVLNYI